MNILTAVYKPTISPPIPRSFISALRAVHDADGVPWSTCYVHRGLSALAI